MSLIGREEITNAPLLFASFTKSFPLNLSPFIAMKRSPQNSSLVSVSIPETLKSIGWFAFSGCSKLERMIIPKNVTEIGYSAFGNANNLVIYAPKGSYAYQYAKSYGIRVSEE